MRKIVKILIVIILILLASVAAFVIYQYTQPSSTNVMKGDHNVLLLTADPSEKRPGVGGVDMAFVIHVKDGNIKNLTPVYPGGMTHPTAQEPAAANAGNGKLRFHDVLWDANVPQDTVLAQQIVKYNTNITTDAVVIVTPDAVDAVLNSIGPINIPGYNGNGTNAAVAYIRNESEYNKNMSRGNATETLMKPVMAAAKDPTKAPALFSTIISQYSKGNIIVVPSDLMTQFAISKGLHLI
jgi:anionic cell wall polymer biosynthesis LytR-Cps2A-Psr (LCP) family protein